MQVRVMRGGGDWQEATLPQPPAPDPFTFPSPIPFQGLADPSYLEDLTGLTDLHRASEQVPCAFMRTAALHCTCNSNCMCCCALLQRAGMRAVLP